MNLSSITSVFSGGWVLYAAVGVAALAAGTYGGYRFELGAFQSYKAQVATNALKASMRYAAQLKAQQAQYVSAVQAQAQASQRWQQRATQARAQNAHLQQEIGHVQFGAAPVAAVHGVCPGDPFGTAEFVRLFNRASDPAGGVPEPAADSSRVRVIGHR